MKKIKPIAVCISDIHFNINNLTLSAMALDAAICESNRLGVRLIIAGDLHDTKAIIRAEVANKVMELLGRAKQTVYLLVGNHDLVNEKGTEHGLGIYAHSAHIVRSKVEVEGMTLIPYQSSPEAFLEAIQGSTGIVVCHQGARGAYMGDYVQDRTSVDPNELAGRIVISGHYHKHQTVGSLTYIGSPFTMTWGEAKDGPKGFLVLNEDGTYERRILELRRHKIIEVDHDKLHEMSLDHRPQDLVWVKIRGPKSALSSIKRETVQAFLGRNDFKLDFDPNAATNLVSSGRSPRHDTVASESIIDQVIMALPDTDEHKRHLKALWRSVV
jgi:DNA repair exonuclease SbcCD nuclease subunit